MAEYIIKGDPGAEGHDGRALAADVVEVPSHNINDLQTAVKGLGIFRLSWCVKEWGNDEPSFRCSECPFEDKDTRKCSVKIFLRQHATREERDRFSPIV